ncbi:unnamed protein product (macronuclear) [Paramecium tetraurelia]|uniref:Cyclic nucleotide-binding domain-containing protein n=1 Tax=Paramecium tetraurelia TaxID=5888 RepID=A0EGZ8_PARTE|nr:uncharacterized protein GSPATT00026913001 [Paramecium tetraurelia]CAK94589.1 unnamed protein product [Paramecium tetraurelia]|eukprot:XP_001461962.1 hypothetical protein (macronuclear) [Paramecium tetraurelia strain d4-2]
MNSQLDDGSKTSLLIVLHKKKFTKIDKNSPKSYQDECLEPPSFFESFYLNNSGSSSKQYTPNAYDQINQYLFENFNRWDEVYGPRKEQQAISQNKKKKNQEIQSASHIALLINCLLILWNNIFKALLSVLFPHLILFEEDESINHLSYFLLFYILIVTLTYILCQFIQMKHKENLSAIYKFKLIDDFIITNILLVGLLLIQITLNTQIIVIILSLYFFNDGYNQIEKFFKLLIITKKKCFNYLAISKIIIYYLYLIHLFACVLYQNDFQLSYRDSLFININFFTFQANYHVSESSSDLTMIFSQIVGLIMLFNSIDVIIQIRLKKIELLNRPKIDVHILHYYIWHHKGNLLEKLKMVTQLNNNSQLTKQIGQNAMRIIFQQIMEDYLEISHIFTKQFVINLSEKIKVFRKTKEIDFNKNRGLYLILRGQVLISFKKEGLRQYQQIMIDKVFGLIDCFQKNISDIKIKLNNNFLVLFIKEEDFKQCLNLNQDLETFHMIKNRILFEGDTSYVNYRCLICRGFHLMRKCQVQQDIYKLILKDYFQQNKRIKVQRRAKKDPQAFKIYQIKIKKQISVTVRSEIESNESSSIYEQLPVLQDEPTESSKFFDRNMINGQSKGTITIPTISKECYGDFISDKILLEQMKSCHKQASLQPSIQPGSQQFWDGLRTDYRSQQLSPSTFKFQDIVIADDIDTIQEYVYFHPEFNISSIISILEK